MLDKILTKQLTTTSQLNWEVEVGSEVEIARFVRHTTGFAIFPMLDFFISHDIDTRQKGPTTFGMSSERHSENRVKEIALVS